MRAAVKSFLVADGKCWIGLRSRCACECGTGKEGEAISSSARASATHQPSREKLLASIEEGLRDLWQLVPPMGDDSHDVPGDACVEPQSGVHPPLALQVSFNARPVRASFIVIPDEEISCPLAHACRDPIGAC